MQRTAPLALLVSMLLALGGCQRLDDERTVPLEPTQVHTILFSAPRSDQQVSVTMNSPGAPVEVYVVLEQDREVAVQSLEQGKRLAKEQILAGANGHLAAWDPLARKEVWRVQHGGPWNGGVLSTAGNLVVQGQANGEFNIYRADTGEVLWTFDAQSGIVAAPVTAASIGELASRYKTPALLIDLRAEGRHDPPPPIAPTITLAGLFAEFEAVARENDVRVAAAKAAIARCASEFAGRARLNPFGWHDLCA